MAHGSVGEDEIRIVANGVEVDAHVEVVATPGDKPSNKAQVNGDGLRYLRNGKSQRHQSENKALPRD